LKKILLLGLLGLSSAFGSQIAQYVSLSQGQDYALTNVGGTSESLVSGVDIPIGFFWAGGLGLPAGMITAKLNFSATSNTPATVDGSGNVSEQSWSGTFSILDAANKNLLSGTFGPTGLFSSTSNSASFSDSTPALSEVTFTSDFLDFSNTSQRGLSVALTNFQINGNSSNLSVGPGGFPTSGNYAGTGSFSSTFITPEPSSLTLIGSSLVGLSMLFRRRRS